MAKKNTATVTDLAPIDAAVDASKVEVIPPSFTAIKDGIVFSASFRSQVIEVTSEVGGMILSFEAKRAQRVQVALTLWEAFETYKKLSGNGLPAFVSDCLVPGLPRGYGKPKSADRDTLLKNPVFRGVDVLIKKANEEMKRLKENQALIAAGISPDDDAKVKDHQKDIREKNANEFARVLSRAMVNFDRNGVNDSTVQEFLLTVLKKREKENPETLNTNGKTLALAINEALNKARGKVTPPATPTATSIMDKLKTAIADGDNSAIGKLVTPEVKETPAPAKAKKAKKAKA